MTALPAITVWQPWATLIALGLKPYEFRGWPAPKAYVGKRIAIHAGARPVRKAELLDLILRLDGAEAWSTCLRPEALPLLRRVLQGLRRTGPLGVILPLSHIVCTAMLGEPTRSFEIVSEFGGVINDSDRDQHSNWAWPLTEIQPLEPPLAARGAQGFWMWEGV